MVEMFIENVLELDRFFWDYLICNVYFYFWNYVTSVQSCLYSL